MYLLLLLLWILLNGRLTLEIFIFGVVIASAIYWFMCHFLEYSSKSERLLLKNIARGLYYIGVLFVEIIKSAFAVLKFVMARRICIEPQIVKFHVPLKSEFLRTILANSITLTPGTITINVSDDEFYVHALDYTLTEGIENSIFLKILMEIEDSIEEATV